MLILENRVEIHEVEPNAFGFTGIQEGTGDKVTAPGFKLTRGPDEEPFSSSRDLYSYIVKSFLAGDEKLTSKKNLYILVAPDKNWYGIAASDNEIQWS